MLIRQARCEDISAIVQVHIASFQGFFLTMLGRSFLTQMYDSFLNQPNGMLIVAVDEQHSRILGFAAGSTAPEIFFRRLKKKKWFSFFIAALPGIAKHPIKVLKKLYYAMFYKGDRPAKLSSVALLSSIAVSPEFSGQSVGKALLHAFEQRVGEEGISDLYLITDKFGNDAVVNFYFKAGYSVDNEFSQPDGRRMLRLIKSI